MKLYIARGIQKNIKPPKLLKVYQNICFTQFFIISKYQYYDILVLLKGYFDEWTACKSFIAIVVYVINICVDLMNYSTPTILMFYYYQLSPCHYVVFLNKILLCTDTEKLLGIQEILHWGSCNILQLVTFLKIWILGKKKIRKKLNCYKNLTFCKQVSMYM